MNKTNNFQNEKEKENLVNSIEALEKTNHEMRLLIENLHEYKANLEDELKQNKEDFIDLEKELQELKKGLHKENQKNQALSEENKEKEIEIQVLMDKIDNIEKNFMIQNQEIKMSYESAIQYLNAEIELHKKSLIAARNTIEDCHKSYIELKESKKAQQNISNMQNMSNIPNASNNQNLENCENQVKNLEFQLNEKHKLLKENIGELEQYRFNMELLTKENQELKNRILMNEQNDQIVEDLQAEISKYQAFQSENQLLMSKTDEINDKYQRLLGEYDAVELTLQEKEEHIKKAMAKHNEAQTQMNDILRTNTQLKQVNDENSKKNDDLKQQNERLKAEIAELLTANENLNKKIEELAYQHQECFDSQRLEKNKIYAELEEKQRKLYADFDEKQRKLVHEQEFYRKELENQVKTLELQFTNEKEAFIREKKSLKASFELEIKQLSDFNSNLKNALYEHEAEINRLKSEKEVIFNEKNRLEADFEAQMMNFDQNNDQYRKEIAELENTCHMISRENQINRENILITRENPPDMGNFMKPIKNVIRGYNVENNPPNISRFNASKVIARPPLIDFDGNRFGRTGNTFERKTLDLLKNNDRLNEQILRRCREIVGE